MGGCVLGAWFGWLCVGVADGLGVLDARVVLIVWFL